MPRKAQGTQASPVAYFSMEVALDSAMPTYSGGLGVLAGDLLRAAADAGMAMVGVTLLYRKGYFRQHLDAQGKQSESPAAWSPEPLLQPMAPRVQVSLEGRPVTIRAWRSLMRGVSGGTVPVYFLDTALPENSPWDQAITDHLYGGDDRYRLCQETVLGMGGVAMLRALGYERVQAFHMNEGHSALLGLALLEEQTWGRGLASATPEDVETVRQRCVFTTHTPVRAAHDRFPLSIATQVLGRERVNALLAAGCCDNSSLDMTYLALSLSRYINGVAMLHRATSAALFPDFPINAITNGVHAVTWTSYPFRRLYDRHIPDWRLDNRYLRHAVGIPVEQIQEAHAAAKGELLTEVSRRTGTRLDPSALTLGFARRATAYKRHDLLLSDPERLRRIARQQGPLQVVYGGKAHPRDEEGKAMIQRVFQAAAALRDAVRFVYVEDYDMAIAQYLCAGVDLWLNTPQKYQEASGTSGMKAALNGVPSLSVLDGWWVEGRVEGVTGWAIGDDHPSDTPPDRETASLYDKLEYVILPMFTSRPLAFAQVMRSAIALNGSFFNAQRMVHQYAERAYAPNTKLARPQ
ncbi:MAG: alpha-glucan family phosphorylase [Chloroflexi bacterium]|nr:alpha-glucan family phosphorylase [Chloroflexota bacterium]